MGSQIQTCGRILLADDGSEHARAAAELVSGLPLPPECQVTVLRVFGSRQAAELSLLEEAVLQTCAVLEGKGFKVNSELLPGFPAQKITEYADEHKLDLIVIGAKGLRATFGILLGGIAQQVVEYSNCPVLVVRKPHTSIKRALFVTDGSANSRQAMEYLGHFPFPQGLDMRVMHVLPPPPFPIISAVASGEQLMVEPLAVSEAVAREQEREQEEGQALLDKCVEALAQYGMKATAILKRGDAATEIIEYIKDHQIDLTISGSRGLSRIRSWLMGSVSRKLVQYSTCSTLIVRAAHTG